MAKSGTEIAISVVIPTRNRADLLERALVSLTNQTFPYQKFEVIVVDNGSTDHTEQVCTGESLGAVRVLRIYDDRPGLHVGRHVGLNHARGRILAYVDDDIEAFPTLLEGIAESFVPDNVALVGGKCLPKFEIDPPAWVASLWKPTEYGKLLVELSLLDLGEDIREIPPSFVFGCNFSIRKSVLREVNGFHPDAVPQESVRFRGDGETHVSNRIEELGYSTVYNPKASVFHFVPASRMTVEYMRKRAFNQGVSDSFTSIRADHLRSESDAPKTKRASGGALRTIAGRAFQRAQDVLTNSRDYRMMRREIKRAHSEGFQFHQDEVAKDPELLKWVLKEDYLGGMELGRVD